ncbi:MAG: hypothetical protein JNN13_07040 [Planctomycetes bacterium]|nr:hypothetical protein [Planctomycetota bacterium]
MRTRRLLVAALCGAFFATATAAQGCPTGTFWKRDTLPDVPTGLTGVSVIQGMCEGESAGIVFEMPANMPPQRITQVVAPWGAGLGVNGFQALLDVEVYDGVSFSGAFANMGTLVFSLTQAGAAEMNVQSHGLNTLDTSTFNIIVGNAPATGTPPVRRFAICFRTNLNLHPSGSCASGWPANFFTDNAQQPGLFCNNTITPQRTSLIEIQGQGWRDAALATVTGIPLCPIYYSGIWCIRCCSEDAYPAFYTTFGNGCPNSLGVSHLIPATLPRLGQNLFVIVDNLPFNLGLMITGASNSFSTLGPLPIDMTPVGMPGCNLRVSLDFMTTLVGGGSSASYLLAIPNSAQLLGAQLFQQPFVFDPPLNAFGGSLGDAATMQIGS